MEAELNESDEAREKFMRLLQEQIELFGGDPDASAELLFTKGSETQQESVNHEDEVKETFELPGALLYPPQAYYSEYGKEGLEDGFVLRDWPTPIGNLRGYRIKDHGRRPLPEGVIPIRREVSSKAAWTKAIDDGTDIIDKDQLKDAFEHQARNRIFAHEDAEEVKRRKVQQISTDGGAKADEDSDSDAASVEEGDKDPNVAEDDHDPYGLCGAIVSVPTNNARRAKAFAAGRASKASSSTAQGSSSKIVSSPAAAPKQPKLQPHKPTKQTSQTSPSAPPSQKKDVVDGAAIHKRDQAPVVRTPPKGQTKRGSSASLLGSDKKKPKIETIAQEVM